MATQSVTPELTDDLIQLLGSPEAAAPRAKRALILELLREARLSQGQTAQLLGISRAGLLDLMRQAEIQIDAISLRGVRSGKADVV